ncbi:MAG: DUF4190 domain-containing protein [Luteolibacter sp.]
MQITLQHNGQPIGPFPIEQVIAGLANGVYLPGDLAWYPGAPGWVALASVPGIAAGTTAGPGAPHQTPRTCGLAIWSLVLGILSFLCLGLTGIPGVICGHLALGRIKRSNGAETGSGLAIAGLVTGYVGIFIIGIAFLAGLTAPLVIRQRKKADQTQAVSSARQLGLALFEFESEYGAFPNEDTVAKVAANTGSPAVSGRSSNARFRQLIRAEISQTEMFFYAHAQGMHAPDNVFTGDQALEKGECAFAYVENLDPKDKTPRPIAMTPFISGTDHFDYKPFDGKAVILWSDNSVRSLPIDRATGQVMLNGKNLLDPTNPVWSGKPLVLLLPE